MFPYPSAVGLIVEIRPMANVGMGDKVTMPGAPLTHACTDENYDAEPLSTLR